jgi:hypothetical protein
MMPSKTLVSIGTLLGVLLPLSVAAYVPPDQAFTDPNVYQGFNPPPSKRSLQEIVEERERNSAAVRDAAHAAANEDDEEAVTFGDYDPLEDEEDDSIDESEIEDILKSIEESLSTLDDDRSDDPIISKERPRLLDRLAIQQLEKELHGAAELEYTGGGVNPSRLHGGAPLQPTGPASIAAGVCLAAAGLWTILRAGREANVGKR